MPKKLRSTEAVRQFLVRRFDNQHRNWLAGEGSWPLLVELGIPGERELAEDPAGVRTWAMQWTAWQSAGEVVWEERRFARLGTQKFPGVLRLDSPAAVAAAVEQETRWQLAVSRYRTMVERWPVLENSAALTSRFDLLADSPAADFERLCSFLAWIEANPVSNLYVRQLPVEGLDTKWLAQRTGVVGGLVRALLPAAQDADFYEVCGLRKPPHRIRIRILCAKLRELAGGVCDLEAPAVELARLPIAPHAVVIVENLETGLAFPDIAGAVAIMKLGNAVSALSNLPWLQETNAVYWGDIDTHGFAILDRARLVLPQLRSVLMDEQTVLAHRPLWGREDVQCPDTALERLTGSERTVYRNLRSQKWTQNLRLEQERIPWTAATRALEIALQT